MKKEDIDLIISDYIRDVDENVKRHLCGDEKEYVNVVKKRISEWKPNEA